MKPKKHLCFKYEDSRKNVKVEFNDDIKIGINKSVYATTILIISNVIANKVLENIFTSYINTDDLVQVDYILNDIVFESIGVKGTFKTYRIEDIEYYIQEVIEVSVIN